MYELTARHGKGTAWKRHGRGMLCVNRPLHCQYSLVITPPGSLLHAQELTLLNVKFLLTYKRDIKSILIHLANEQR